MRRLGWLSIALILVTAGCLGLGAEEDTDAEPAADEPVEPAADEDGQETEAEGAADEETGDGMDEETQATGESGDERTLNEPPQLADGEWWTVAIESEFTGLEAEATVVKAGGHGDEYMIGMPDDEFVDDAVLLHFPPHGSVEASTLGYPVHGPVFEPVTFPLEEGRTWETTWINEDLEAEVVEAGDGEAVVEMVGDNQLIEVQYDAELGYPKAIAIDGYGSYEVIDHGYGYDGDVHVPWDAEVVFMNGRIAGAIDLQLTPAPPVEEIEVTGDHDEAVVALLLGNVVAQDAPGVYRASATAPDGTTLEGELVAQPGGESFAVVADRFEEPTGTWQMEYVAGGAGVAAAEGIAYDAMHVVMEDGEMQGMMDMG